VVDMKKVLALFCLTFCLVFPTWAIDNEDENPITKYYYINPEFNYVLKNFSKTYVKSMMSKEEKREYKKLKKIDKCIKKQNYKKAFDIDEKHFPTIASYYHFLKNKKEYSRAIDYLKLIILKNEELMLIEKNELIVEMANLCYEGGKYQLALDTITQNKEVFIENDYLYYVLHDIHYNLENYSTAIYYAKKIENNKAYSNLAKETLYLSYRALKNDAEAYKYAIYLAENAPCETNYLRVILTTKSVKEKTHYLEKLLDLYGDLGNYDKAMALFINELEPLLNEKVAVATKNLKGYFSVPCWSDIFREDYKYMRPMTVYYRQKDFYKDMTNCIDKYKNDDLKACFKDIVEQQKIVTQKLIEEKRAEEQRLAEQQRLREMQLMNYNMQIQNNLIRQQNYELSRPRYYNSTTTQYGNTYYTNTYRY
jgi:hypothetical protein